MKIKIVTILVAIILLAGCNDKNTDLKNSNNTLENATLNQTTTTKSKENTFPGSYIVPDEWIKWEQYSTDKMSFYIEKGHEKDEYPDNISISIGTNRYSAEEHTVFRDAIVQQLLIQLEGVEAQLNGNGSYTKQGYVLYTFTIDEAEAVTKQYYIVKDYGYCLIQVTNFSKSENIYEAAQSIVDSFVWETEHSSKE